MPASEAAVSPKEPRIIFKEWSVKAMVFSIHNVLIYDDLRRIGSEDLKQQVWRGDDGVFGAYSREDSARLETALTEAHVLIKQKGDRTDIIHHVCTAFGVMESEMDDAIVQHSNEFERLVHQSIVAMGVSDEVKETLQILKGSGLNLYIMTGEPTPSVRRLAEDLGIADFFVDIRGGRDTDDAPNLTREDILHEIKTKESGLVCCVGYQPKHQDIAEMCDCEFIGIRIPAKGWTGVTLVVNSVADLVQ